MQYILANAIPIPWCEDKELVLWTVEFQDEPVLTWSPRLNGTFLKVKGLLKSPSFKGLWGNVSGEKMESRSISVLWCPAEHM